jgi:hypothetical protein
MIGAIGGAEYRAIRSCHGPDEQPAEPPHLLVEVKYHRGSEELGYYGGKGQLDAVDMDDVNTAREAQKSKIHQEPVHAPEAGISPRERPYLNPLLPQIVSINAVIGEKRHRLHCRAVERLDEGSGHRRDPASTRIVEHVEDFDGRHQPLLTYRKR